MENQIIIKNARLHNLKNIDLVIPKNILVVLSGLSGSGKSTLGFDILNMEGQRQYLESLGLVGFGVSRPPVDSITGLSPTISIDQRISNHSPRSTVGTTTDVFTYLRILFARLCHRPCPHCGKDISPINLGLELADQMDDRDESDERRFPCPHCGNLVTELNMANFSFNKPDGACPTCTGLGTVHQVRIDRLIDPDGSMLAKGVIGWDAAFMDYYARILQNTGKHYGVDFDESKKFSSYSPAEMELLLYGTDSSKVRDRFPNIKPPTTTREGKFEGVVTNLLRRYDEHAENNAYREKLEQYFTMDICPDCHGTRLKTESRNATVAGSTIIELAKKPINTLSNWLDELERTLTTDEEILARSILDDLKERVLHLLEVGVGYLSLERSSTSLSAGETQRIRLASLLGSGLTGVLYILDEPTIGLHSRDTQKLIHILQLLRDLGNTVLVIEHDLEFIQSADHLVDFGPGAGKFGGRVVATGSPVEVCQNQASITGAYLAGRKSIPVPQKRRETDQKAITIYGARQFNLKNITVRFPLNALVAITGVSGSGKSSLMFEILDRAARKHFYRASEKPGDHDRIEGFEYLDRIISINQEHIGRIPRSNAATYTDTFTPIRNCFAQTSDAVNHGFAPRHFSFNVPGGRCDRCEGAGTLTIKMQFLPEVEVRCPVCHGHRFKPEILSILYHGKNISEVLDMTIDEAMEHFVGVPAAISRLKMMSEIGLGYLQLGQSATTLSGGEAQRIKLAKELGRRTAGSTLYLLDEPTTGLHPDDTGRLLNVLQHLVDAGNTVFVVEHNMDVIKTADWVIDLGPEGGPEGGFIVAQGTPEDISLISDSHTGNWLKKVL